MKRALLSALVGGLVSLGSALVTAGSGEAPITEKQIYVMAGAFLASAAKDFQSGIMPSPSQRANVQGN